MARINLTLLDEGGLSFANAVDRSGEPGLLPFHRLVLSLYFVPPDVGEEYRPAGDLDESRVAETIVDTGAPLTILPHDVWQPVAAEIRWLQPSAGFAWPRLALAGGRWTYRVGRVRVAAFDPGGRWLPSAWVAAMCLEDHADAPRRALLGLQSALLLRRRIRHAGTDDGEPTWWLEDSGWW